ncbi:MAG: hypothetical protein GC150_03445 [Rhizobiales bacterium]|nr:hypothetical protein [Hyphomicrobiales bacterium]
MNASPQGERQQSTAPAATGGPAASASSTGGAASKLDDVMIAMDVVDTLRHDASIVARELDESGRREALIERLREIYRGQGIEVADRILEEGVRALGEKRFVYEPRGGALARRIALIYATRWSWGRQAGLAAAVVAALWLAWYAMIERPRSLEREALAIELTQTLPAEIASLEREIAEETDDAGLEANAARTAGIARAAAAAGRTEEARAKRAELEHMLARLREEYVVRIVTRRGSLSGLWRIPKVNPDARNFYLIVEAVGPTGVVLSRDVENEETGTRDTVTAWGVRVPKHVLDRVQEDKSDDGIIQNVVVAHKPRGVLEPQWLIEVEGGTITEW